MAWAKKLGSSLRAEDASASSKRALSSKQKDLDADAELHAVACNTELHAPRRPTVLETVVREVSGRFDKNCEGCT